MKFKEFTDNDVYVFYKNNGGVMMCVREINKKYVVDIVCDSQGNVKSIVTNEFTKTTHDGQYLYTKSEVMKHIDSWLRRENLKIKD